MYSTMIEYGAYSSIDFSLRTLISKRESYFTLDDFNVIKTIQVLFLTLVVATLRVAFQRLSMESFVTPRIWACLNWFSDIGMRFYSCSWHLWLECSTLFLFFHGSVVLHLTKDAIGPINDPEVTVFDKRSAAAPLLNFFAIKASSVSPMTSLRRRSEITCFKTS